MHVQKVVVHFRAQYVTPKAVLFAAVLCNTSDLSPRDIQETKCT